MRTMLRFRKFGAARYISHLDLMRTMNRAIRRAGLPAVYSQGFHPHIVMSFAQALGLGYLSESEMMEIELDDAYGPEQAVAALNRVLPGGIEMTGAWTIPEELPTLMSMVSAARWLIRFRQPVEPDAFAALLGRDRVDVTKEGKNGPSTVDIRSGIYTATPTGDGVELFLAAGSALNIRPELVVTAALGDADAVESITRLKLYFKGEDRLVPFDEICMDGEPNGRGKDHIG